MFNDPELDGKYLGTITRDFVRVADTLKEAAYQIRKRGISEFPVFPICQIAQPVGQLLLGRTDLNLDWNYYASFLAELQQRGIVDEDKVADFIAAYKDPDEFACLLVIAPEFTNFVFVPFPED
ncbi:MAG: hypothetical protein MUC97_03840 [Bernardetiaceae bacterium]|jgi:hypothetical protein|nr:hypothetical protein [Bernardetiaceae bacterium]